jgi:glutaredoxin 3
MTEQKKKVKIYTTPTCGWCVKAKELLTSNNIPFEAIDVSTNQEARNKMVEKSGQMGVPVLDIDGTILVGFDIEAIEKALAMERVQLQSN